MKREDAVNTGSALAKAEAMKKRTQQFALRVMRLCKALPKNDEGRVIGRQLLRSGTSVGANYRAVCRARSTREFASKMNVVVEEADESAFWIELLIEGGVMRASRLTPLLRRLMNFWRFSVRPCARSAPAEIGGNQ